jgi:hypothetical protein
MQCNAMRNMVGPVVPSEQRTLASGTGGFAETNRGAMAGSNPALTTRCNLSDSRLQRTTAGDRRDSGEHVPPPADDAISCFAPAFNVLAWETMML